MPDEIFPKEIVSQVFVLRCHPKILERRLRAKKWRINKMRENVLAEIIDSCLIEAVKRYGWKRVMQLDTTHANLKKTTASAKRYIIGRPAKRRIKIDWLTKLEKEGMLERYLK
jgi:adenylate kinase